MPKRIVDVLPVELPDADRLTIMRSAKVVVGTGEAPDRRFLEAVHNGCCPVAPRTAAYVILLGERWPYYGPESLPKALAEGWKTVNSPVVHEATKNVERALR